jgi:thiol-disulfide isomerase/thioredoxin
MNESKTGSGRTWWIIGLGFVLAWGLILMFFGPNQGLGTPQLGDGGGAQKAAFDWTLLDLNDAPVDFSQYKGRTVFLTIWATWCPPCVAELPAIATLAENPRLKEKDVAFVCVSTDESSAALRRFMRDKNWPMTVLRATELPDVFLTEGIPATFLIAPDGRIAASEVGAARWDDPSVVEFLERLAPPAVVKR